MKILVEAIVLRLKIGISAKPTDIDGLVNACYEISVVLEIDATLSSDARRTMVSTLNSVASAIIPVDCKRSGGDDCFSAHTNAALQLRCSALALERQNSPRLYILKTLCKIVQSATGMPLATLPACADVIRLCRAIQQQSAESNADSSNIQVLLLHATSVFTCGFWMARCDVSSKELGFVTDFLIATQSMASLQDGTSNEVTLKLVRDTCHFFFGQDCASCTSKKEQPCGQSTSERIAHSIVATCAVLESTFATETNPTTLASLEQTLSIVHGLITTPRLHVYDENTSCGASGVLWDVAAAVLDVQFRCCARILSLSPQDIAAIKAMYAVINTGVDTATNGNTPTGAAQAVKWLQRAVVLDNNELVTGETISTQAHSASISAFDGLYKTARALYNATASGDNIDVSVAALDVTSALARLADRGSYLRQERGVLSSLYSSLASQLYKLQRYCQARSASGTSVALSPELSPSNTEHGTCQKIPVHVCLVVELILHAFYMFEFQKIHIGACVPCEWVLW